MLEFFVYVFYFNWRNSDFIQFEFTWSKDKSNKFKVVSNMLEMENSNQEKSKSQQPKRRVFEIIQKNLVTAGITPDLANKSCPLNATTLLIFLSQSAAMYFTSVFIIYDAESIADYTQSIYTETLLTMVILALLILILKAKQLFEFIDSSNDMANTSEWLQHESEFMYLQ